jgi:spondin-1
LNGNYFKLLQGDDIRTIVKARGLQYPNLQGKTFAVFRVDPQHHLISFVTKLAPSPDWFVGVNNFELCLANGSWVDYKEFNLYPYDAGTNSGSRYDSPKQTTYPPAAVSRIRPNYPNNPNSPFYDPDNKEMRPIAKMYLKKQRLYEKACDNQENNGEEEEEEEEEQGARYNKNYNNRNDDNDAEDDDEPCAVTDYIATSKCSAQCGEGIQSFRRTYVDLSKANRKKCSAKLREDRPCTGYNCNETPKERSKFKPAEEQQPDVNDSGEDKQPNDDKDDNDEEDIDPVLLPKCEVTDWEEESCSVTCGKGKKTLRRKFLNEKNRDFCVKKYKNLKMQKTEECTLNECKDGEAQKTVK